ncbi:MAG: chemotaxis protein CheD [Lachnospiraceae bacterium]|nr:chemotaxis protein CheD [Lachnospiraceae bacterium]
MSEVIKVGMADLKICKAPDSLTTLGLGSCVGVALYDSSTKVCGLVHVMLPYSTQIRNNSNIAKFADTGIVECLRLMVAAGANRNRITAKIAGGATMFTLSSNNDTMRVGERNAAACKEVLKKENIRLLAEDTGLNYGRTVVLDGNTGNYLIKAVGKPDKVI